MTTNGVELTEAEKLAKVLFMRTFTSWEDLYKEGISGIGSSLPDWYNEELYKKGQKFFKENRTGILYTNYLALVCSLSEPHGVDVLKFSGGFKTPDAAKNRNIAILIHTLYWYKYDLSPGSKSLKSFNRMRRIHYMSSKALNSRGQRGILQSDLVATAFGFLGLILARLNVVPVRTMRDEELKGLVHFWAVMSYMIGIRDEYNFYLLPVDALLIYCQMMVRYMWLPLLQILNSDSEEMMQALAIGMKPYLIEVDFDVDLFAVKRLLLVPGYQFNTNYKTEVLCRSILNQDDVDRLNTVHEELFFSVDIPIIEVTKDQGNITVEEAFHLQMPFFNRMDLKPGERIKVRMVNYEKEWQSCLNSSKYHELPLTTKIRIMKRDILNGICDNLVGRFLSNKVLSLTISAMKRANKRVKNSITTISE